MRLKCNTCGGEYDDVLSDGMRYFHSCAPVWDDAAKKHVERANKRDENVPLGGGEKDGAAMVKAKGAGVTKL